MFSFTGSKKSFAGDVNFYGKSGVRFFTQLKTITAKWKEDDTTKLSTSFPTYKWYMRSIISRLKFAVLNPKPPINKTPSSKFFNF